MVTTIDRKSNLRHRGQRLLALQQISDNLLRRFKFKPAGILLEATNEPHSIRMIRHRPACKPMALFNLGHLLAHIKGRFHA